MSKLSLKVLLGVLTNKITSYLVVLCLVTLPISSTANAKINSDLPTCPGSPVAENTGFTKSYLSAMDYYKEDWDNCVGSLRIKTTLQDSISISEWKNGKRDGACYFEEYLYYLKEKCHQYSVSGKESCKKLNKRQKIKLGTCKNDQFISYSYETWGGKKGKHGQASPNIQSKTQPSELKKAFVKKSVTDRKSIQSNLSKLGFYKSSIDGLYGKGTAAALKAYNKEYLGDAELSKTANVNALLKDIIKSQGPLGDNVVTPMFIDWPDKTICRFIKETGKKIHLDEAKKRGLSCGVGAVKNCAFYGYEEGSTADERLCREATSCNSIKGRYWDDIGHPSKVREAKNRGLSCGVEGFATKFEPKETPEPELSPKLDIAQVQTSYDAKDFSKAFADAQILAIQGDPKAQLLLGKMFADGRGTLQVSTVAHMWFNIASMGGIDEAYEQRKAITAQMTPAAVEEAQKMAMKCIQSNYSDCGLTVTPTTVAKPKTADKTYITDGSQVGPWFKDETLLKRKQLQYALKKLGVYNSSVDGLWGANTSRAFTRYMNKDKRDAENVEEVFASVLSKVKVPSSFASTNRSTKQNKSTFSVPSGWRLVTNNPQHSFEQANAICKPISENAGASAKSYKSRTNSFNCFGNSYSVNCNRNSGGFAEGFAESFVTGMNRKRARQRAFASCMAEYGWVEK